MRLKKLDAFNGRKGPLLLVVADGVGLAPPGPGNAVALACTPVLDALAQSEFRTKLKAHGTAVGLPSDDDMGNSEVGHNALGAGRVFAQGAKLVGRAFADDSLFANPNWQRIEQIGAAGGCVHFLGLLSDGNVHSHLDHLSQMLRRCAQQQIASAAVHVLFDGRDVAPRSALQYLRALEATLSDINQTPGRRYRIASGGGRMAITMDRYQADWSMVKRGYDCHVHGIGNPVKSAAAEVQRQYDADADMTDQTLAPFVMVGEDNAPLGKVCDGDAMVLFNFRGDRAIEISRAMEEPEFSEFDRGRHPQVFFCGMLEYDGDLQVPKNYLVAPPTIERPMMQYMCAEKLRTFAVSETQKFGHVTYFWNGNRSGYFDEALETYIEVPSDNIAFNRAPEMKAREITAQTIRLLRSGEYDFGRINFANGDMVGHTGDIQATVQAMQCVDACLGELIEAVRELEGVLVFTADHGNAEDMLAQKDGVQIARTSHTLNPVAFYIVDANPDKSYAMRKVATPGLANVAATVFNLLGYAAPEDYAPSLIEFPEK